MGIVVIGAVFVDIKGYPEAAFIPTGRNAGYIAQIHGGVARNVVEDIANCELRPTYVGLVDKSAIGDEVLRKLRAHKVNTDYVRATDDGLGTWLAVFDSDGDVYASVSKRPDLSPICDILDEKGDEIFSDADSIVVEIDMDKSIIKRVFKLAQKYGKKVYAVVSNMSIALERRDFLQSVACFTCNQQEAGMLFYDDYTAYSPAEMQKELARKIGFARIPAMIVTMGDKGAVYAELDGNSGFVPARKVAVNDTTGAGDAFCAGVAIGLTYGLDMAAACQIGSRLAASVIVTSENVCPRFLPRELGLDIDIDD